MGDPKPKTSPTYWMVAGVIVIILGAALSSSGNDAGVMGLWAGGAMLVFGVVAKAIELGVRSANDD